MALLGVLAIAPAALAAVNVPERASLDSSENQSNGTSRNSSVSADGRYVAFQSYADNLVASDTNVNADIFVRDTVAGTTERISVSTVGTQGNGDSLTPVISDDGRYVAFQSYANNLVAGDGNGVTDIFVRDRADGTTQRVSVDSVGAEGNAASGVPAISGDGGRVAFFSDATNLVAGDTNATRDIFIHDLGTAATSLVSVHTDGTLANDVSAEAALNDDGRYVVFTSLATNLIAGDSNGAYDVFLRDTQANTTTRVSLNSVETEGNGSSSYPDISADGRYVVFESAATNLVADDTNGAVDIFVRDRNAGTTWRIGEDAQPNGDASFPVISEQGRFVAYRSQASNLVPNDTNGVHDIFVFDSVVGATLRVSVPSLNAQANGASDGVAISSSGSHLTYHSAATNLVAGDTNAADDVFFQEAPGAPPSLTLPANLSIVVGPEETGAVVPFSATATDIEDGNLAVTCDPVSGATFPLGTTTATCRVSDSSGWTTVGSFSVTVTQGSLNGDGGFSCATPATAASVHLATDARAAGAFTLSIAQLKINQRIGAAAVRRANAIQSWLDAGISGSDLCGGALSPQDLHAGVEVTSGPAGPAAAPATPRPVVVPVAPKKKGVRFTLSSKQLQVNQRIYAAAVRRANALAARLEGGLTGGDLRDGSVPVDRLRRDLSIVALRPAAIPPAPSETVLAPRRAAPKKFEVSVAQLRINQRIAAAAVRRTNALRAQLQTGLTGANFADGSIAAADIAP